MQPFTPLMHDRRHDVKRRQGAKQDDEPMPADEPFCSRSRLHAASPLLVVHPAAEPGAAGSSVTPLRGQDRRPSPLPGLLSAVSFGSPMAPGRTRTPELSGEMPQRVPQSEEQRRQECPGALKVGYSRAAGNQGS